MSFIFSAVSNRTVNSSARVTKTLTQNLLLNSQLIACDDLTFWRVDRYADIKTKMVVFEVKRIKTYLLRQTTVTTGQQLEKILINTWA